MEGLYYPYSENKGADQLRGHREADLHLCFRICKKPVFSRRGSYGNVQMYFLIRSTGPLVAQVVECPLLDREVAGLNLGRAITKALKIEPVASLALRIIRQALAPLLSQTSLH